jgi:phage-related protein
MPSIGSNCHELRIADGNVNWRIIYGLTSDAVVILEVVQKKTRTTPKEVIAVSKKRWKQYLSITEEV